MASGSLSAATPKLSLAPGVTLLAAWNQAPTAPRIAPVVSPLVTAMYGGAKEFGDDFFSDALPAPAPESELGSGAGSEVRSASGWRQDLRVESELRLFPQTSAEGIGTGLVGSMAVEAGLRYDNALTGWRFSAIGFARQQSVPGARSHADVREFVLSYTAGPWEAGAGVDRRFWGVLEAGHLVNIVNQTDALEDVDDEDQLGQPMAWLGYAGESFNASVYALPLARERPFPQHKDRPSGPVRVDPDQHEFAGGNRFRPDWAARLAMRRGKLDVAVVWFDGLAREPLLTPTLDSLGNPALAARYDPIRQASVEGQYTSGAWLLKLEALHRWQAQSAGQGSFAAGGVGVEYSLPGRQEISLLAEYYYDERGGAAAVLQNDAFVGMRWAGGDVASSQWIVGALIDRDRGSKALTLEATRRLSEAWSVSLDGRFFENVDRRDALAPLADDDFVQVKVQWRF